MKKKGNTVIEEEIGIRSFLKVVLASTGMNWEGKYIADQRELSHLDEKKVKYPLSGSEDLFEREESSTATIPFVKKVSKEERKRVHLKAYNTLKGRIFRREIQLSDLRGMNRFVKNHPRQYAKPIEEVFELVELGIDLEANSTKKGINHRSPYTNSTIFKQ